MPQRKSKPRKLGSVECDVYVQEDEAKVGNRCPICFKIFRIKNLLTKHVELHGEHGWNGGSNPDSVTLFINENEELPEEVNSATKRKTSKIRSNKSKSRKKAGKFMCLKCNLSFVGVCDLSAHMLKHTQEKAYRCKVCGKSFVQEHTLEKHMKAHPTNILKRTRDRKTKELSLFKCNICHALFKKQGFLERHKEKHASCQVCHKVFKSYDGYKRHILNHMPLKDRLRYGVMNKEMFRKNFKTSEKLFMKMRNKYEKTGKVYEQWVRQTRRRHLKRYRKPMYRCMFCGRRMANALFMIAHRKTHGKLKCAICNKTFLTKQVLQLHLDYHKTNTTSDNGSKGKVQESKTKENNVCTVCKKTFSSSSCLSRHRRVHTGEKPFKCKVCGRGFCERSVLEAHSVKHTGIPLEKKFKCDKCGKGFTRSSILCHHVLTHAGENLKCEHCGKIFQHRKILDRHLTTHVGQKNFQCQVCDRKFLTKSNLKRHIQVHTGEKPYKCDMCDRAFAQEVNLKTHKLTHTGTKPHKCPTCDKAFTQIGNLRNHMNTHTGETPFTCNMCPKSFAQNCNLQYHKKRIHKEINGRSRNKGRMTKNTRRGHVQGQPSFPNCEVRGIIMDVTSISQREGGKTNVKYRCEKCEEELANSEMLFQHMQAHNQPHDDIIMEAVCSAEILQQATDETKDHNKSDMGTLTTLKTITREEVSDSEVGHFHHQNMELPDGKLQLVAELALKQHNYIPPNINLSSATQNVAPPARIEAFQGGMTFTNVTKVIIPYSQHDTNMVASASSPYTGALVPAIPQVATLVDRSVDHSQHSGQHNQMAVHPTSSTPSNAGVSRVHLYTEWW